MNYKIPKKEVENVLSAYWQMLQEIEHHTDPKTDPFKALLVESAYIILNRSGIHNGKPRWKENENKP